MNDLTEANKIIKKIENRDSKLLFLKLGTVDDLKSVIFAIALYTIFQMRLIVEKY